MPFLREPPVPFLFGGYMEYKKALELKELIEYYVEPNSHTQMGEIKEKDMLAISEWIDAYVSEVMSNVKI